MPFLGQPHPPDPPRPTPGELDYPGLEPLPADMVVFAKVGVMQLERLLKRHAEFECYLADHGEPREFS